MPWQSGNGRRLAWKTVASTSQLACQGRNTPGAGVQWVLKARTIAAHCVLLIDPAAMFRLAIRITTVVALVGGASASLHAEGLKLDGLRSQNSTASTAWPRWQARIGIVGAAGGPGSEAEAPRAAALLGDYYFTGSGFDPQRVGGGLRATTGWLYGGGQGLDAGGTSTGSAMSASFWRGSRADDARTRHAGYIGIGYTGLVPKLGLGFSADFGVIGMPPSATSPRLESDYTIRDIRLAPTVRLGVSYAF
jgi:hypothetical protein